MKGITINHNGKEMKMAVVYRMITVHLFNNNSDGPALTDGESRVYIGPLYICIAV
jgi:hypothetical protein